MCWTDASSPAKAQRAKPCELDQECAPNVPPTAQARGLALHDIDGRSLPPPPLTHLQRLEAGGTHNLREVVAEVARLIADAGPIVIVSVILSFRAERQLARQPCAPGNFVGVFVDAPLDECKRRGHKAPYS